MVLSSRQVRSCIFGLDCIIYKPCTYILTVCVLCICLICADILVTRVSLADKLIAVLTFPRDAACWQFARNHFNKL